MAKRRYTEEIGPHGRIVRRRIKDWKAIARYREPREKLFAFLFGDTIAKWCADNNVPFYGYELRKLLSNRKKKIRLVMKRFAMTRLEAIEDLNEQLWDYQMRRYVDRVAPELSSLDFHMWPAEDRLEFEENWAYDIYASGSP